VLTGFLVSCETKTKKTALKPKTILEKIATAHGISNWEKVNKLDYTFNVDRGENHFERIWSWEPKTNKISMTTKSDTVSYLRKIPLDSLYIAADKGFINDKFWLLAPFNLVWDKESFTYTESKNQETLNGGEAMNKLTIVYKNKGGYTPGDAYDFYYKDDFVIREWVFRKENSSEPSLVTSWEDYETIQGLKISKTRKNKDGSFKLYFSNLK
jgi:hypothetical protein